MLVVHVLQIYRSTMRTETDRRGFGGKVSSFGSAYAVLTSPRVLRNSTLRVSAQDTRENALARFVGAVSSVAVRVVAGEEA